MIYRRSYANRHANAAVRVAVECEGSKDSAAAAHRDIEAKLTALGLEARGEVQAEPTAEEEVCRMEGEGAPPTLVVQSVKVPRPVLRVDPLNGEISFGL